ncbi:PREDICTED: endonuclease 2 isoform X2 [Ipomoea nil]|uniref:endonuclease 2 isoform X2 n=1 Tax=Ipomoea nil TaxID=35883 RepID=UPI000901D74E|nr:PREDICTED: endonuclease 2 isoform X2 [Ipomoea nil]
MENKGSKVNYMLAAVAALLFLFPVAAHGWGVDGHLIACRIAQSRLSAAAADAVDKLLPAYAKGNLSSMCSWADNVRFRFHWSAPLHFINTPDVCNFQYKRDCKDEDGEVGRCVAGAINNYTTQLVSYVNGNDSYNSTQALLFLSHFVGDIHQPLHCGFASDKGGNTIDVKWYTKKTVLHHVWDTSIIETAEEQFYDSEVEELINAIQKNITTGWADEVKSWEACTNKKEACPDVYASESIKAACDWAYKGVSENSVLEDPYFLTRLPVVKLRLAQAGVRLAAILNRIFG